MVLYKEFWKKSVANAYMSEEDMHSHKRFVSYAVKKGLPVFPSPAGMPLTFFTVYSMMNLIDFLK